MIGLHTPREVIDTAIHAARKGMGDAPEGSLGHLMAVRTRLHERGLLDMAMAPSSVEALFDEVNDELTRKAEAERSHVEAFVSHKRL